VSGKIVGIIGGMGPEATVDLMSRIIKATSAEDDIDHIRMVVDNNPKVPSRVKALLDGGGESPVHCLQDMARRLAAWGVDFLAMPCNTAHYFHKDIQDAVSIPVLDMIALAAARTADSNPGVETVGLLASTATINLNLYEQAAAQRGLTLLTPAPAVQAELMAAIRRIKTGRYGEETETALQGASDHLVQGGAGALLVACTELSVLSDRIRAGCPVLDSAQILAEAIVREAI
jgi:aspartate racemase